MVCCNALILIICGSFHTLHGCVRVDHPHGCVRVDHPHGCVRVDHPRGCVRVDHPQGCASGECKEAVRMLCIYVVCMYPPPPGG